MSTPADRRGLSLYVNINRNKTELKPCNVTLGTFSTQQFEGISCKVVTTSMMTIWIIIFMTIKPFEPNRRFPSILK